MNKSFRDYTQFNENIKETYFLSRKNQTVRYVKKMRKKYLTFEKKMKIKDVFKKLEHFVDISDPDIALPNYYHGLQTAEGLRKDGHPEWMQVVGLIHDIGKIIYLWGDHEDGTTVKTQWGIVGDTFIVGCKFPEKIVYPEFNTLNTDVTNPIYNTKLGIYNENCGLDNVMCSWGHDEYLYHVLKHTKTRLPDEALYIIRYHSLYPYHKHGEYSYFSNEKDKMMMKYLKIFNLYDLYTKNNETSVVDNNIIKYYDNLIEKYIPGSFLYF